MKKRRKENKIEITEYDDPIFSQTVERDGNFFDAQIKDTYSANDDFDAINKIENDLKQSQNQSGEPTLKKLKNPFKLKSILLSFFSIFTLAFAISLIWIATQVEDFNIIGIAKDIFKLP